jgi:hypothetical protein
MTERPRKNRTALLAVLAAVTANALALAAVGYAMYGRGLDSAGERTCARFASSDYNQVTEIPDRIALANRINGWAAKSRSGRIAATGRALVPAASGTIIEWRMATRAMDFACSDAGWVPD